jgi:hypothetical protein
MTSREVYGVQNLGNRKTARIDTVAAMWSDDEKMALKRPHGL